MYFCHKIKVNNMDSKELYAIYEQHPVITTDSRDCPEGSIFIALKAVPSPLSMTSKSITATRAASR